MDQFYTHPSKYHNHTSLLLYIATIPQLHQHHSYSQGPSYTHPSRYHTLYTYTHMDQFYTHPSKNHNHTSLLLYIATIPQLHQHHTDSQGPSYTHPSRYHTLHRLTWTNLYTPIQVPQPHFIATVHSYYTPAASTPHILTRTKLYTPI
jgi:hypothetical protein